jgi:ABC-type transporter Mla subunit MlaD
MGTTDDWNSTIDKLVAATADARDVIREAHGVTRDLRHVITEARHLIGSGVEEALQEKLGAAVKEAVDGLGKATRKAMEESVDKVNRQFDELAAVLTGTDRKSRRAGKPGLDELIEAAGDAGAFDPDVRARALAYRKPQAEGARREHG